MGKDDAAIRDQLGNDPEIIPLLNADYYEEIGIEEGPTVISTNTLGHVWIAGSSTNGIVGSWTGTQDGQQLVVGPDGDGGRVETTIRVVNPENVFHERLVFNYCLDTTNSTATIDLTNNVVRF